MPIYDTSKKNGKESIFEIQYQMGDQGQQSDWLYYFIPKTTNAEIITGVPDCSTLLTGGWNVPTPEMIASYEPETCVSTHLSLLQSVHWMQQTP